MTTLVIVGETWEAPFAAATLHDAASWLPESAEILVPPELDQITGPRPVTTIGRPPDRFRCYDEIVADVRDLLGHRPHRLLPAGLVEGEGQPRHRPPDRRRHRYRRVGALDIWTADTGDGYFAALLAQVDGQRAPVWPAYGAGRPVFTINTNDFNEPIPQQHDDYVILASGLLGLRMVLESDPAAGARVFVYDINPDQLAWYRFVLAHAAEVPTLAELVRWFKGSRPGVIIRPSQPHELGNAAAQASWYEAYRHELAALPGRVDLHWLEADLLNQPADVLSVLRPERSVFFVYLDLFVVWHVHDDPPWIVEFPGLARSLEIEVRSRTKDARFLPGPDSNVLQLDKSPLLRMWNGDRSCT